MEVKNLLIIIAITLFIILVLTILLAFYYNKIDKLQSSLTDLSLSNKTLVNKSVDQSNDIKALKLENMGLKNEIETLNEMLSLIPKEGAEQLASIFGNLSEKFGKVHDNLKHKNANDLSLVLSQVEQDLSIVKPIEEKQEYINIPDFLKTNEKTVNDSKDDAPLSQEDTKSEDDISAKP